MLDDAGYLGTKKNEKGTSKYYCKKCDYSTSHTGLWNKHLKTKKHNAGQMLDDAGYLGTKRNETKWQCNCGKQYKHNQSYYRHKKTCTYTPPVLETETQNQIITTQSDREKSLEKQVDELRMILTEQTRKMMELFNLAGHHNTTNTNSHNTNINLYLNTHCKDAMSIQAFASQLAIDIGKQPQLLCNSKDHKPLCDFISEKMTVLDQTARPVHSHKKTMYLKDEAKGWNKDTKGDAANTVIGAAKKADLDKLPSLYPTLPTNDKQQEVYLNTVSDLMEKVSKKNKEEFEKMDCIELDIE